MPVCHRTYRNLSNSIKSALTGVKIVSSISNKTVKKQPRKRKEPENKAEAEESKEVVKSGRVEKKKIEPVKERKPRVKKEKTEKL